MIKKLVHFLLLTVILTGCGGGTNLASSTSTPRPSSPTQFPITASATPGPQSVPSTPERYPAWVEDNIGNVKVEFSDDFDTLSPDYLVSSKVSASGGVVNLPKPNANDTNGTYWINNYPLSVGRAVLIRFRYTSESDFNIGFRTGEYGTPDFRWVGVDEKAMVNAMQGTQSLEVYPINEDFTALTPNTWTDLMLVIDEGGDFLVQIAPADDPGSSLTTRVHYSDDWASVEWNFSVFLYDGEISLDHFDSLSYNGYPNVAILPQAQQCSGSESFPHQLRADGNQIINESGQVVMLRGIAIVDPLLAAWRYGTGNPSLEQSIEMVADWGANVVRIPVHPFMWRYGGISEYLQVLDQTIALACQHHLYAILEFHSIGFPPYDVFLPGDDAMRTTRQEIREFWEIASARYVNNDAVAFYELFGEPVVEFGVQEDSLADWLAWKNYIEDIIDLVRIHAPEKTVIVGGLWYTANLGYVPQYPIDRPNVAYSVHPYPGSYPDSTGWDMNIGRVKQSYPVIATEFGFEPTSPYHWSETNHSGARLYRYEIIDYLESHQVSWVVWILSSSWGPPLLERNFTPTEAGEYFRNLLLELNQGS
jgi:endoglucanase